MDNRADRIFDVLTETANRLRKGSYLSKVDIQPAHSADIADALVEAGAILPKFKVGQEVDIRHKDIFKAKIIKIVFDGTEILYEISVAHLIFAERYITDAKTPKEGVANG